MGREIVIWNKMYSHFVNVKYFEMNQIACVMRYVMDLKKIIELERKKSIFFSYSKLVIYLIRSL